MGVCEIGLLYLLIVSSSWGATQDKCRTPQYFDVGEPGTIKCDFGENFYAVAWYNSGDVADRQSICRMFDNIKEGVGCLSGEYDIRNDGSLIINNVSLEHDHNFTVFEFHSQDADPLLIQIEVVVIVKSSMSSPGIQECEEVSTACFMQLNSGSKVSCYVTDARPAVSLKWVSRTVHGDMSISSQVSVKQDGALFTSLAITQDLFSHSSLLDLLVCKAIGPPGVVMGNETIIFIENGDKGIPKPDPIIKYIEQNDVLKLKCSDTYANLIVWKRWGRDDNHLHVLFYAALFELEVSRIYLDEYVLQSNGTLIVPGIEVQHEGLYGCVVENNHTGDSSLFDVHVYVPASPVVEGCTQQQYCVLEVQSEGNLSCSVTGIRPQVQLQWKTLFESDSDSIVFFDNDVTTSNNRDVFDVQITSRYRLKETRSHKLTLECSISGSPIKVFPSTAQFDIFILDDQTFMTTPTMKLSSRVQRRFLWIILPVLFCAVFIVLFCRHYLQKDRRNSRQNDENNYHLGENVRMLSVEESPHGKEKFVSELKARYQNFYDAVQPIPYLRDRLYSIDRVFVEGGIEYLKVKENPADPETWRKLDTYHNIFDGSQFQGISTRFLLEGDPGYGKSTLTLQFAYDWCNKITVSSLKNTDILILLRLRQLGGVKSIYKAIKEFLLPKDSRLSENDIENILARSSSVVIILDGFDEYGEKDIVEDTDVISIIKREMFQEFTVLLTTRSSCLPKEYSPTTQRIRLTGFDEIARDRYLYKVVGEDTQAAHNIRRRLQNNPVLGDICHVPLFFVMFAHMSYEKKPFEQFNSVTTFFRYLMTCFHSHMKNKIKDKNDERYASFEVDHIELDKLAFERLRGGGEQFVWTKNNLRTRLDKDFYDYYVRLGILVEEEVLDFPSETLDNTLCILYETGVRFYHNLFCEWYAAHFLSQYASRDEVILYKPWNRINGTQTTVESNEDYVWLYLDPFKLQYTYRFACGLNSKAAEKIIAYLKSRDDTHKFAILCFLEQSQNIEVVLQDVKDLCSGDVSISNEDSRLLQRSTIQLLEIACSWKITISRVRLIDCFKVVDSIDRSIQLKSDLFLPVFTTLKELWIWESGKSVMDEELTGFSEYLSTCHELIELRFVHCLLPQTIQMQPLSLLRSRNIRVVWNPSSTFTTGQYKLNLDSGLWQHGDKGNIMTNEKYQQEKKYVERL